LNVNRGSTVRRQQSLRRFGTQRADAAFKTGQERAFAIKVQGSETKLASRCPLDPQPMPRPLYADGGGSRRSIRPGK